MDVFVTTFIVIVGFSLILVSCEYLVDFYNTRKKAYKDKRVEEYLRHTSEKEDKDE